MSNVVQTHGARHVLCKMTLSQILVVNQSLGDRKVKRFTFWLNHLQRLTLRSPLRGQTGQEKRILSSIFLQEAKSSVLLMKHIFDFVRKYFPAKCFSFFQHN